MSAPQKGAPSGSGRAQSSQTNERRAIVADPAADRKAAAEAAKQFLTLQARAALAGCELHELAGGGYLLSRWGLTRELHSIDEVQALLARMGGTS